MKQTLPLPLEHQIQQEIINYLRYKGWYCMRLNAGRYSVGEGRSKRYIMGQEKGTPDLLAFSNDQHNELGKLSLFFIEVKRPGKYPSFIQEARMQELEKFGAKCLVVHGLEELQKEGI